MWCLGTWFGGDIGNARLATGFNDPKGLFQHKCFYENLHISLGCT